MKVEFSRQIFEKYANVKIHENSFSGCRIVPCRRTDRHDEADSRFSQFSNSPRYKGVFSVPISSKKTCRVPKPYSHGLHIIRIICIFVQNVLRFWAQNLRSKTLPTNHPSYRMFVQPNICGLLNLAVLSDNQSGIWRAPSLPCYLAVLPLLSNLLLSSFYKSPLCYPSL
jgi:hypothetical protein